MANSHGWKQLAGVLATSALAAPQNASACHDEVMPEPQGYERSTAVGLSLGIAFGQGIRFSYGFDVRVTSGHNALVLRLDARGLTSARAVIAAHRLFGDSAGAELGVAVHSAHKESEIGPALAMHVAGGPFAATAAALQASASIPFYGDLRNYEGNVSALLLPSEWKMPCSGGRRLRDGDSAVLPAVAGFDCPDRGPIARAWIEDARAEYASIWAFERMAAELRAAGAPDDLVRAARRSAADEACHVDICGRQAAAPFTLVPLGDRFLSARFTRPTHHALATLAREAWVDGCLGEGIAAAGAASAADLARGDVIDAQRTIAVDERRHAELAWAILEWTWREGGTPVRDAIVEAISEEPAQSVDDDTGDIDRMAAAGRGSPRALRIATEREIEQALVRARRMIA